MKSFVKRIPPLILTFSVIAGMVCFLAFPARYSRSVAEGISLWAVSVLPATFPFLFLTAIFTRLGAFSRLSKAIAPAAGKLFRVSGAGGCAAALSALSGYPVGARSVLDLRERGAIAREETFRLACLCSTTGPMFLVGAVGAGMFRSAALGWLLLLSHYAGVWTVCALLRFTAKRAPVLPVRADAQTQKNLLYDTLYRSVVSVLCVGGSIALFYAFGEMLSDLGAFAGLKDAPVLFAALRGLLEMTSGCSLLAASPTPLNLALACFLVTFGGLCVIAQQTAFLSRAGVKTLPFVAVKCAQGVLAAAVCYLLCLLFGV